MTSVPAPRPADVPAWYPLLRARIDEELVRALDGAAAELTSIEPAAAPLVTEIRRIVEAGGKRLRPVSCYWGFRACGGEDGAGIVRAAASLELLHTMALIHDDVVDETPERRGVPASHRSLEGTAAPGTDPVRAGRGAAIVTGDLAAVLSDRLLASSGFPPALVTAALERSYRMRLETAAGEFLDVTGIAAAVNDPPASGAAPLDPLGGVERAAALKGGSYTVEGPLLIGAALAGAPPAACDLLSDFGRPLGAAFQLRDDLTDGDARGGVTPAIIDDLLHRSLRALDRAGSLDPEALGALHDLAAMVVRAADPGGVR